MNHAVTVDQVSKIYSDVTALDSVSFGIRENTITGLLGRNGAGKTTLMQILTGQEFASSGRIEVFGEHPYENEPVLAKVCFIKESQKYPEFYRVGHVLHAARMLYANWDEDYAQALLKEFQLPVSKTVRHLSRGMLSSLGVILGLASRAPLTFFDEPYLGLDAIARQLFYDRLLEDFAEHPRTIVLSTHLIDEASDLIEQVLIIDKGGILIDEDAETLRGQAMTVVGPAETVEEFAAGYTDLHREQLGGFARVTLRGAVTPSERARAESAGLTFEPVSLQQLVVRTAQSHSAPKETAK